MTGLYHISFRSGLRKCRMRYLLGLPIVSVCVLSLLLLKLRQPNLHKNVSVFGMLQGHKPTDRVWIVPKINPKTISIDRTSIENTRIDTEKYQNATKESKHITEKTMGLVEKPVKTRTNQDVRNRTQLDWPVFDKSRIHQTGAIFPTNGSTPITVTSPYLIPNTKICYPFLTLTYVIIVHSAPSYFDRRRRLRKTWANQNIFKNVNSRTVFLLGSTPNLELQQMIHRENEKFGDIVQGTFKDDYKNLTLKAVMGLRWVTENCRHANYIIKTDDDVFINMRQVLNHVFPTLKGRDREVVCSVALNSEVFRVGNPRLEIQKWVIERHFFPGLATYPMPFCYGYATFYSVSLATELFEMAKSTPFYRLDDVYVYGILLSKVKGATWRNAEKAYCHTEGITKAILKSSSPGSIFLVGTARSDAFMQWIWDAVNKR